MSILHDSATQTAGPAPAEEPRSDAALLEWRVHLFRRNPARGHIVLAAMAGAGLLGFALFHSFAFVLLGPLMVFSATAEYLLPVRYRLTERGAHAAYGAARLEIAWEMVRRVDRGQGALKLSPFNRPNRLDSFRGVLLRFAPDGEPGCRTDVLRLVERFAQPAEQNRP